MTNFAASFSSSSSSPSYPVLRHAPTLVQQRAPTMHLAARSDRSDPVTTVAAVTALMSQTVISDRTATEARMAADAAHTDALAKSLRTIEELTDIVNQLSARVATLEENRAAENLADYERWQSLQRQVCTLAAEVRLIEKQLELIKPAIRYYILNATKTHDTLGNTVDPYNQIVRPPRKRGTSVQPLSETESWLRMGNGEEWQSPGCPKNTFGYGENGFGFFLSGRR